MDSLWPDGTSTAEVDWRTQWAAPSTVTSQGRTTTLAWDGLLRLDTATNPNGGVLDFSYDAAGRPQTRTMPDGQSSAYSWTGYTATESGGGRTRRHTFDGFGRTKTLEEGGTTPNETAVDYEYTPCACAPFGKLKRTSRVHAPGAAATAWDVRNYDILGRVTRVDHWTGGSTTYAYAFVGGLRELTVTAPGNRWKKYRGMRRIRI